MGARIAAFACGVIILYSGWLAPEVVFFVAIMTLISLSAVAGFRRPWLAALLAGLVLASGASALRLKQTLPTELEGQPVQISGYLCDVPAPGAFASVRFSLCVTGWQLAPAMAGTVSASGMPRRLRLSWYGDDNTLAVPSPLTATVVLKRPHGAVNPGGFRYETWLFRKGYRATGTVRELSPAPAAECGLLCRYHQSRQRMVRAIELRLEGMNRRELALSLMLGYRGGLEQKHWEVLNATGTIHLVAISGLHLGMVAVAAGFMMRQCLLLPGFRRWPPLRQKQLLFMVVMVVSLIYALLAGFTVPTRRALIMVAAMSWMLLTARTFSPWQGLLIAAGLVLLLDPFSPLDQGFWLSFGAVVVLVWLFSRRIAAVHPLTALLLAQGAVFAGLWPILALLGQPASLAGLPANLFAIPWLSLVVMPLLMAGSLLLIVPGSEVLVGPVLDVCLAGLWQPLVWMAELPWPELTVTFPVILGCSLILLLILWFPDQRFRYTAVAVMAVALLVGAGRLSEPANVWREEPELWFWDVGQGLAVTLAHQGEVLVYDTGPESPSGFSAVSSVLLPSHQAVGIHRVDYLVVSHGDRDHAGGLSAFLEAYDPRRLMTGERQRLLALVPDLGGRVLEDCQSGQSFQVGEVRVELWQSSRTEADGNDRSCVISLGYRDTEVLLPGDISRTVESEWLADNPGPADRFRVVLAPHHGSKTSSDPRWVSALAPDLTVFTAGYRHRYGHPHPDVIARYRTAGSALLNTAVSGAIRLRLEDRGAQVTLWRDQVPYWFRPAEPVVDNE